MATRDRAERTDAMKKSQLGALGLVAVVTFGLVGCGTSGTGPSSPTDQSSAPGGPSGPLSVMAWGSDEDKSSLKAIVDAYSAEFPEVKIDFQSGDCAVDLAACKQLIAGGTMPDVVIPHNSGIALESDLGILANLDPFIERDGLDMSRFAPAAVSGVQYNGSTWALPMGYHIEVMYYNKDLFDAAGIAYPPSDGSYTYDDVREWAKKLTKDASGKVSGDAGFDADNVVQWGLYNWPNSLNGYDPVLLANGGSVVDLNDPTKCTIESPAAVKTFQFLQDMMYTDHSMITPPLDQAQAGKYRFAKGEIGMLMGAGWMTDIMQTQGQGIPYDVAALPKGDAGNASIVNVHSWAVYEGSQAKETAWHFIKWAATDGARRAMGLIPANPDIVDEAFLNLPDQPEHNVDAFITPASWPLTMSPPEFGLHFAEISGQDGLAPIMESIYLNTAPAAQALNGACAKIQPLLDGA